MALILKIDHLGEVTALGDVGEGPGGTDNTVAAMWGILDATLATRHFTEQFINHNMDPRGVYEFLYQGQRFQADPKGIEFIRTPITLMMNYAASRHEPAPHRNLFRGDCDDVAMLGVALLAVAGYWPVLVVSGNTPRENGHRFRHILFGWRHAPGELGPDTCTFMDPQERRPIGHVPPEGIVRIYEPTGEHAKHLSKWATRPE